MSVRSICAILLDLGSARYPVKYIWFCPLFYLFERVHLHTLSSPLWFVGYMSSMTRSVFNLSFQHSLSCMNHNAYHASHVTRKPCIRPVIYWTSSRRLGTTSYKQVKYNFCDTLKKNSRIDNIKCFKRNVIIAIIITIVTATWLMNDYTKLPSVRLVFTRIP